MPDATAKRFLPNPCFDDAVDDPLEQLMYRTGDRAKFLPDGTLELLGRCDFMVKVRGYSVVLSAVESALAEHDDVSTAVVLAVGDEGTDKRLVAYVVPAVWGGTHPPALALSAFLKDRLPFYAIPSAFIMLKALPVQGASGKLDRKKLPDPAHAFAPPAGAPEREDGTDGSTTAHPETSSAAAAGACVPFLAPPCCSSFGCFFMAFFFFFCFVVIGVCVCVYVYVCGSLSLRACQCFRTTLRRLLWRV